ncbi:MAG: hypothetical protein FWH21_07820 [Kiritimatiellaeota bacterium]|nr:hypothetical protein [Kiritimatiellota bacterium]
MTAVANTKKGRLAFTRWTVWAISAIVFLGAVVGTNVARAEMHRESKQILCPAVPSL